jgi:hypothetical protein
MLYFWDGTRISVGYWKLWPRWGGFHVELLRMRDGNFAFPAPFAQPLVRYRKDP